MNEKLKAKRRKKAAVEALLSERLRLQWREEGVRKGLTLSSSPEAKNSSKR